MATARRQVPATIRAFMRLWDISQHQLGEALGLTQTQVSRRLSVPGSLSYDELEGIARFFSVPVTSFSKPLREALADLPDRPASLRDEGKPSYLEAAGQAAA